MKRILALVLLFCILPGSALGDEKATVVMQSGLVITIDNSYKQIVDAVKGQKKEGFLELNVQGSSLMVNLKEVVVVCKDSCSSMVIVSPARR